MSEDYALFCPLAYYSEYLSVSQQDWHPFKQELYGKKKAKTFFRRELGQPPEFGVDGPCQPRSCSPASN